MTHATTLNARVFLTDWASYNNGTQFEFGHWVDLRDFNDYEELQDYIKDHFAECDEKSPIEGTTREEYLFSDIECDEVLTSYISESHISEDFYNVIELIDDASYEPEVYAAFFSGYGQPKDFSELEEYMESCEEAYQGSYKDDIDFAETLAEGIGAVDESANWPNNCIDWERAARDLMYDYFESEGHYFRSL